jgi:hypothetical protein
MMPQVSWIAVYPGRNLTQQVGILDRIHPYTYTAKDPAKTRRWALEEPRQYYREAGRLLIDKPDKK